MHRPSDYRFASLLALAVLLAAFLAACGDDTVIAPQATVAVTAASAASTTTIATVGATSTSAASASPASASASPTVAPTRPASPTTAASPAAASPPAGASPATAGGGDRYAIVPESSKATYQVRETFVGRGVSTAVGSTSTISGDLFIDKQKPSNSRIGTITVDISKLASDSGQRDRAIRDRWLESNKFPQATLKVTRLEGLPDAPYTEGQELTFKIVGDLTVRTVTKPVTFDAKGKIEGDTFKGTATTKFEMKDFGFDPPEILGTLKAEGGVDLTIDITAKRAP